MTKNSPTPIMHTPVAIIGAGVAGLTCAGMIQSEAILLEAADHPGGRVWGRRGAELIHGTQTALTDYLKQHGCADDLRPLYIVSHADGGPSLEDEDPTLRAEGLYGIWYIDGNLYRADEHPYIMELRRVLDKASECRDPKLSVLDMIPPHLHKLAIVSFGNTAGCTDLSQISASMLLHHFEKYWEEEEEPGDYFLDADLVGLLVSDLPASVQLKLKHSLEFVAPINPEDEESGLLLTIKASSTEADGRLKETVYQITADSVVISIPPRFWRAIMHPSLLPEKKLKALETVGMEPAIKIVCHFETATWDPKLQQIICMDEPIPEVWFDGNIAVGFLMSGFADTFDKSKAVETLTRQLCKVLGLELSKLLDSSCTEWKDGGYMFPRVGMTTEDLRELSISYRNVYYAGEATHAGACCTIQAAMETGNRAATALSHLFSNP